MDQSLQALNILFNWENLSLGDLKRLTGEMNIKNIRWLAIHHPDNKTRENLFRLSNVMVGEKTVINMGLFVYDSFKPLVKIGSNCDLAANISLIAESAACMSELSRSEFVQRHYFKTGIIIIEDHCWIGSNVIVLPGVIIGHHSIIGAGSIITKNIPPSSVVKGQPGIITKNISGLL
jgi:acetyltransferase-like isoleucine patch superfamily enzyme